MGLQRGGNPLHLAGQGMRVKRGPVPEESGISAVGLALCFCVLVGTGAPLAGWHTQAFVGKVMWVLWQFRWDFG